MHLGPSLDAVLESGALSAAFQPIVDGGLSVFTTRGVEGLVRAPNGSPLVTAVRSDEHSRALIQSIVGRAAAVGARVVAEGGCPADIAGLAHLGVALFQGPVLSPAVAAQDVRLRLELPASPADSVEPVPRVEA